MLLARAERSGWHALDRKRLLRPAFEVHDAYRPARHILEMASKGADFDRGG
jgi:hypothetical protein